MVEAVIAAGISALLYHLGMGFLLFGVPLQVVLVRRGRAPFLAALGMAFALILAVKLVIQGGGVGPQAAPFLLLEMFVVLALLGGLVLIQLPDLFPGIQIPPMRRVTRLVLATAAVGVLSIPLIVYLRSNEPFNAGLREVFDALAGALQRTFGAQGEAPPNAVGSLGAEAALSAASLSGPALMQFVGQIFWRGFLFSYMGLLGLTWWLATRLGLRFPVRSGGQSLSKDISGGAVRPWPRIAEFRLPDTYVWPLIASLAVILLGLFLETGPLGLAAWNAGVILLFLYGISGIGVLQYLLRKLKVPRGMRILLGILLCLLVISPRANLAVFILIPGLGVSEIWLKYRTRERSNG